MDKSLAIKLMEVEKVYQLHHEKPTFVENIVKKVGKEKFLALSGINLEIKKGERVGIIGVNGSGKTTLLKIISKIATPTSGKVETQGKLVSLIDLSAGFHPELTGEENIFLNGLLIGMSRKEIIEKFKSIVKFADINGFIDAPLYTYSSGMKLRVGFSVAIHSNPDILILDEGMAVGDNAFRTKVSEKIKGLYDTGITIVMVSHWMHFLSEYCQKIIWMDGGRIRETGNLNLMKKYEAKFL